MGQHIETYSLVWFHKAVLLRMHNCLSMFGKFLVLVYLDLDKHTPDRKVQGT